MGKTGVCEHRSPHLIPSMRDADLVIHEAIGLSHLPLQCLPEGWQALVRPVLGQGGIPLAYTAHDSVQGRLRRWPVDNTLGQA